MKEERVNTFCSLAYSRKWTFFLAITLFAAAIRLYRLDQGLWNDEIMSALLFFHAPWKDLVTTMPLPNHHPLYSLLAKLCLLIFGEKEWALRIPAYIAGSLTPGLLYLFGRRFRDAGEGILAGVFMSLAMWPVWWSQDARGYAFMILFSLAAIYLFMVIYEKPDWRAALAYVLCAVLAVYSHLFAAAVIGSHLVIAPAIMLTKPEDRLNQCRLLAAVSFTALVVSFLLYLPMLDDFFKFVQEQGTNTSGRDMTFSFLGKLVTAWTAGRERLLLSLPVLLPAAAGLVVTVRQRPLVAALLVLPLVAGVTISFLTGTFVFHRFYSYGICGLYLFCAAGIVLLWKPRMRAVRAVAIAAAVAVTAVFAYTLVDYYGKHKQALRPASEWTRERHPHKEVIALGLVSRVYFYYDRDAGRVDMDRSLSEDDVKDSIVVTSFPWSISEHNRKVLSSSCRQTRFFSSAGSPELDVRVYECE